MKLRNQLFALCTFVLIASSAHAIPGKNRSVASNVEPHYKVLPCGLLKLDETWTNKPLIEPGLQAASFSTSKLRTK